MDSCQIIVLWCLIIIQVFCFPWHSQGKKKKEEEDDNK